MLLRNPHTDQTIDVTEGRAKTLLSRGWLQVNAPGDEPAVTRDIVDELGDGLAQAIATAEWLVAEAQWERDQALAKLAEQPDADALANVSAQLTKALDDLDAAQAELAKRPTPEQFADLQARLESKPAPDGAGVPESVPSDHPPVDKTDPDGAKPTPKRPATRKS